ncbi:hypothetical protein F4781DRAFT_424571 [Annulohypoxylon bovei var. microspora]|nr:hypothetical protein F4781DRAFT_424571 [Annulohypoxylon bovei var. microspora]
MAGFKRSSKRRSYRRDLVEASSESSDALVSRNRELSSLYAGQLASPPASSGYTIPPSSPDDEEEREEIGDEPLQQMVGLDERSARTEVSSSGSKSEPSTSHSSPQTISREVFEPFDDSKHLSLAEKVKLLKICCSHRSQFLHCSTSGKHAEERIWTSVMEQFATTVRSGVFTKYSEVKKMTNKTCRNRRKHTKGIVPPQRRPRMGDLDMWIDRWVRIWKCRDLVVNIANAHESMRETIGEKKFKRIFRHRVDGSELPQDLGMLTLSAPLWKAIQKRIRTEERSIGTRHISIFPSEDESDWTDEEGTEDEATAETDDEGPPMDSIEEEFQDPPLEEPKGMVSTPNQEVERNLGFPDPSPRTQARLDQFEQGYTTVLKKEQGRTGKQTSVLDLAHKRRDRERSPPASPLEAAEVLEGGAAQLQFEEKGQTSPILNVSASSSNEAQDKEDGRLTSSPAERSVPERPLPGEVDVQRITGANSTRPQRLKPGTYSAGEGVLKLADDEPRSPGDKAITPSSSYSKKRARHQSMTNLSSNSPGNSRAGPSSSFAVPEPLDDITSTSNRHSAKRQRPPPKSEHVQTPVPTPDLTGYGLKPFRHPDLVSAASNNGAPCKEHVHPGVGPVDKGKGRATQSHTDNKYLASGSRPSNGNGYTPKWKTGARNATQSHRFYPYGQPATSSGPAASHKRRKNGGRGKRERHRGLNHHDRASGGSYSSNRFLREVTTDTVDFENFSTGAKCDILRRKISEVNEMLRKIEKND